MKVVQLENQINDHRKDLIIQCIQSNFKTFSGNV